MEVGEVQVFVGSEKGRGGLAVDPRETGSDSQGSNDAK